MLIVGYFNQVTKNSCVLILFSVLMFAEVKGQVQPDNYKSKLIIKHDEVYKVNNDSIYMDTLIMLDNSIMKFGQSTKLIVEHAFIGVNCTFDASGANGVDGIRSLKGLTNMDGENGQDGHALILIIGFSSLGNLYINTTGGLGGKGANGHNGGDYMQSGAIGNDGARGQNGGRGGKGGNGGDINLYYFCVGFIPSFIGNTKSQINAVNFNYAGGAGGVGGNGGAGGSGSSPMIIPSADPNGLVATYTRGEEGKNGLPGLAGNSGVDGKPGELILKRIPD